MIKKREVKTIMQEDSIKNTRPSQVALNQHPRHAKQAFVFAQPLNTCFSKSRLALTLPPTRARVTDPPLPRTGAERPLWNGSRHVTSPIVFEVHLPHFLIIFYSLFFSFLLSLSFLFLFSFFFSSYFSLVFLLFLYFLPYLFSPYISTFFYFPLPSLSPSPSPYLSLTHALKQAITLSLSLFKNTVIP